MNVQTVQKMHLVTIGTQGPGQIEQPQGFGPEVICRKIPDIGIDEEDVGRRCHGVKFKIQIFKCRSQKSKFKVQNAKCKTSEQNVKICWTRKNGFLNCRIFMKLNILNFTLFILKFEL
jgi:hypothetical protein